VCRFYVNTHEQPPRSSWVHPLGPLAPPPGPPPSFPPPANGPPVNVRDGYGGYQGPPGYNNGPGYGGYNQGPGYGFNGPPQGYQDQNQNSRGWFGGGGSQQQQPVYQQAPPKKSGPGIGTAVLAGGAGLVGGALLMDAFEDHDDREREEGYDQGYQNGADDYGGDGGDW